MFSNKGKWFFFTALVLGILFHGVVVSSSLSGTYDAYVHIFFADHYADSWFDTWDDRWYCGFSVVSYPPLIHQMIALISMIFGLKNAFIIVAIITVALFIRGVYYFSKLWVDDRSAGIASVLVVISSSFVEALHIFGQLPSVFGIGMLLNLTPYVYRWIFAGGKRYLLFSLGILAVITSAHHVTTIFGMVFFLFPVIGLAIMDRIAVQEKELTILTFIQQVWKIVPRAILLGIGTIIVAFTMIMPYWLWSKSDPISQVPIPHGSRDSFLEVFSSGLVFFIIPWGIMLFCLPFIFKAVFRKRNIILGFSFALAFLLGTGGTTFIPKLLLGETAFNILTLDRFTIWATVMALPFFGLFINHLAFGNTKHYLQKHFGHWSYLTYATMWVFGLIFICGGIINLPKYQATQPDEIDIEPIVSFLERDEHDQWRYLTLGFGDQMAWLAANTHALTVDGNYHSVRRLPELTTRKVERLENAKYQGTQGIGALQQFLTVPEKYSLKYIFSNDKFYDPLLHYTGWNKVRTLENAIVVWEKPDIPILPAVLPRKDIPQYQSYMWGILPILSVLILILLSILHPFWKKSDGSPEPFYSSQVSTLHHVTFGGVDFYWSVCLLVTLALGMLWFNHDNTVQSDPESVVLEYFDAMDFQEFAKAFSLFDPASSASTEQRMLDLSTDDGITLSYAKLNGLDFDTEYNDARDQARIRVKAEWITSIDGYTTYHDLRLKKIDNIWWLLPSAREDITPPKQIFTVPRVDFKDQGRRESLTTGTEHNDIQDRPEVYVTEAQLVKRDSSYHIIGKIVNIDNDPSYISATGVVFDINGNQLASFNAKDIIKHILLPKEETAFRIDFEDIVYQINKHSGSTFDPSFSNLKQFQTPPHSFKLYVQSLVVSKSIYKYFGISDIVVSDDRVEGYFVNTDAQECSIPQVISSLYKKDILYWVDAQFLERAIKPQQFDRFYSPISDPASIEIIASGEDSNIYVNGHQNTRYAKDGQVQQDVQRYELSDSTSLEIIPSGFIMPIQ